METDYTYIGFICTDNKGKFVLTTRNKKQFNFSGINGNDSLKDVDLDESEAMVVAVKFFDGSESMTLEYAHKNGYEDIIFAIENHGIIVNDYESSIYDMVYKNYEELDFFWGLIEEYYETDKGMKNFEEFVNKKHFK